MGDDVFVLILVVGVFAWSMTCPKFRAVLSGIFRALGR
jgi:hypothetical protein